MRRFLTLSALVLMLVPIGAATGLAQSCGDPVDLATEVDRADAVFMARVESVSNAGRTAEMAVMAVWKGSDLPEHVTVNGDVSEAVGARTFQRGSVYLVFPTNDHLPFADNACSATRITRPNGLIIPPDLIDAVGSASARAPLKAAEADEGSDGGFPIGLGLFFVAIGGIILVAFAFPKLSGSSNKRTARDTLSEFQGPSSASEASEDTKRVKAASAKRFRRARRRSGRW
jgi:hypothetical protein